MAKPLSKDLRERVVMAVVRDGLSGNQAAARFGVAVSTANAWVNRFRQTGSLAPGRIGGHKPATLSGAHRDWLLARCTGGDFTLRGLVSELAAERGLKVDYVSVWRFVHAERLTHKKKTVQASERDRPDIARRRARWQRYQGRIDPKRLVFIDETWTKTNMAPLRGWAPKGSRLPGLAPYGHWNTMTFLAALRHDRIEAILLDGAINHESFLAYVEQVLGTDLASRRRGRGRQPRLSQKPSDTARHTQRNTGARLVLLPKYSPDLNPIEQVFAKLKHLLRKAAARSREAVRTVIGQLLDTYTPQECANYLANSGYDGRNVITL